MIGKNWIKKYCCEDISLIENYDKAINDKTQIWHCHHKAEVLPCGRFSINDLKKFNLYYDRPAEELVFLTHSEHNLLHKPNLGKKHSEDAKRKMSEVLKGKKHSDEAKIKISESLKGNKRALGYKHSEKYKQKMSESRKGGHWYNNGIINKFCLECPDGFVKGMLKRKSI